MTVGFFRPGSITDSIFFFVLFSKRNFNFQYMSLSLAGGTPFPVMGNEMRYAWFILNGSPWKRPLLLSVVKKQMCFGRISSFILDFFYSARHLSIVQCFKPLSESCQQ